MGDMEELPYQNLATIADKVTKHEERVEHAIQSICASQKITPDHLLQHLLQQSNQVSARINSNEQPSSNSDSDDDQSSGESADEGGMAAMERQRSFDAVQIAVNFNDLTNASKNDLGADLSPSASTSSGDGTADGGGGESTLVTSEDQGSPKTRKRRSESDSSKGVRSRASNKCPKTSQPSQTPTKTTQTCDWSAFGVPKRLTQFANRDTISVDEKLTLVILGRVMDHHTHTRPRGQQIKKWKGIVSDGHIRMTAYFIAEDITVDLSETLKHGQIISSSLFSPLREEVNGAVTYCELRFIKYNTEGVIPPEHLPSDVSSISIFTSSTSTSVISLSGNTTPTISNCCGVACTAALAEAHVHGEPDQNQPINVLDTCVATFATPSLSAMASLNSFYDRESYPNPELLPTHHKRQCVYYYFAVHHFDGRGVRVDLPCCVRKKIHDTFPCEDSQCSRLDCPTHCAAFQDAFGFPAAF